LVIFQSLFSKFIFKLILKWEKNQLPLLNLPIEKPEEEELKPSPSTSTKCSSKCTQTSESQRKPWTSWTLSFTTLSTESLLKDQSSSDSTKEELFLHDRFNPLLNLSSQESWQDTPSQKEPKPSQNTFKYEHDLLWAYLHINVHFFVLISKLFLSRLLLKNGNINFLFRSYHLKLKKIMNIKNLLKVDWSKLPKPLDDAKLDHLNDFLIADIIL